MKSILSLMIKIYGIEDRDWMGFVIDKKSSLTFHHIVKAENGGKCSMDNGAILTKNAHDFLHCIEGKNIEIYNEINNLFKIINSNLGNSKEQLEQIKCLIIKYLDMGYDVPQNMTKDKIRRMILNSTNLPK